jgi:hypothetical protein
MTLNQLSRKLVKANTLIRDVNAVKRGKIAQRLVNRALARGVNRSMRRVWWK